jgi:hypothetical protein
VNALRARDLYHIATDRKGGYIAFERSENISHLRKQIYRQKSCTCQEKGRGIFVILRPFLSVGIIQFTTALYQTSLLQALFFVFVSKISKNPCSFDFFVIK